MNAYKWSTTAASNNSAVPDGAPDNWLGSNVNEWGRELMARVREQMSDACYVDETYQVATVGTKTLVRNSTTQIQINSCDATAHFTTSRRIRIVGATTGYGFVTSSSYSGGNTLINVTMESSDVPTSPTQILCHVDSRIRSAAYKKTGAGNGLDADQLDGYHASDIFGTAIHAEALINGSMNVWQRGTSGSCPVGTRTYHADRWWTNPSGAAVTVARATANTIYSVAKYGKQVIGATSVTTCEIAGQRIESYLYPYLNTTAMTISALVQNDTGAGLTIDLVLSTADAADDFSAVTVQHTESFASITSGATTRISLSVDVGGLSNLSNGLQVVFRTPSGALNSGAKSVTISEIQMDRSSSFSYFKLRPFQHDLLMCQRYYQKTFAYETVPAQNWAGTNGFVAGSLVIPGSSVGGSGDNTGISWVFPTPMRATPTVTTYNPAAAAATARSVDSSTTKTVTVVASTAGANLSINASTSAFTVGATAEAEL